MNTARSSTIYNRSIILSLLLCCAAGLFFTGSCGKSTRAGDRKPTMQGVWVNTSHPNERPVITFTSDTSYVLEFQEGKLRYPGRYWLSGKNIRIVDFYCGKALPGEYTYSLSDSLLTFTLIKDEFCNRSRFFPEIWVRQKTAP